LGAEDVLIGGNLEVDGIVYFDNVAVHYNTVGIHGYNPLYFNGWDVFSMQYKQDDGFHLSVGYADGKANRNIIIVDGLYRNKDFDHNTLSANPTLFIHSSTDPDADNTQWLGFTHESGSGQLSASISTGKSDIKFSPSGSDVLFLSGSGNVGIGTTSPDELLHLTSDTSAKPIMIIENTNGDNVGSTLSFQKLSPSVAYSETLGNVSFKGYDSTDAITEYVRIKGMQADYTNGAEEGSIQISVARSGTLWSIFAARGTEGVVLNEDGQDVNFRIESVNDINAFFVEGSSGNIGIGTPIPSEKLQITDGNFIIKRANGTGGARLRGNSGDLTLYNSQGSAKIFISGDSGTDSYFNNGGNVGIGTASPHSILHVEGTPVTTGGGNVAAIFP